MTVIKILSLNQSNLKWPGQNSESEAATVTFYQGVFALLLRVGFIFIQIGCIPCEDVNVLLMQNVVDIFVTLISFGGLGFMIAHGKHTFWNVAGYGSWISSEDALLNEAVRGFAAALTGTAIITTLLSSRIHYIAQMVVSFTFSGIVQPTLLHSASIYSGWMAENRLEDIDVSFKDTAMVLATSIASSTAGMVGCIFLGRRVLRVCNTDPSSIGPTSPGTTVCGYFFILLGFAALALPSPVMEEMQASVDFDVNLVINASVSFAMGIFVVAVFHAMFYQGPVTYWDVLKCFQGGVAGFISVLAAYDLYSPLPSLFIALTGATFFFLATEYVFSSPLEDNCNIIAIHLVCGILSCLMPTFFSHKENIGFRAGISVHSNMMHLAWQVLCCSVVIVVVCIFYTFIFCLLLLFKVLRNKSERSAHERAKRLMKTGGSIVKNEPITDYILPNIAHKGLRNVNKKPVPAAATKMHTYNVSVNTAEDIQLYDGPGTSVEIGDFKVRRASFSHDAVQKSGNISKDKMRRKFQKCKNVFVRNPLHRDSFL